MDTPCPPPQPPAHLADEAGRLGPVLVAAAAVGARGAAQSAERAPGALARAVRERPDLRIRGVRRIAAREQAIGDRVLLVERHEATPRRAMAVTDERGGLEDEPAPGRPLH